jgi:methyl-accepting chemotaxis protein
VPRTADDLDQAIFSPIATPDALVAPGADSTFTSSATPADFSSPGNGSAQNDLLAHEERSKDLELFRRDAARRFWTAALLGVGLATAVQAGISALPPLELAPLFGGAVAANWALLWVASRPRLYRPWLRYLFATCDAALLSIAMLAVGSPVLAIAYLLAIVPASFDRGTALGYTSAAASVAGFLAAAWGHQALSGAPPRSAETLLAAALLLGISLQLIPQGSRLIMRIRDLRARMAEVEAGALAVRAAAREDDELGFLGRGVNRMLDRLTLLVAARDREAAEVAQVARQLTQSAVELHARSRAASAAAVALSEQLGSQQEVGRDAGTATRGVRDDAHQAATHAEALSSRAVTMDHAAEQGDLAVSEATDTLIRIAEGVRRSAERVEALDGASGRVQDAVQTIARLARRTNLLALNAGIEASRANEHGIGFAVVAEEIRTLAQESASAAASIGETVARVRDEIDAAVREMRSTARAVEETEHVAREATQSLAAVRTAGGEVRHSATALASLAVAQARAMTALASAIDEVDALAASAAVHARAAAESAGAQTASSAQVSASATQLAAAAARLRADAN